MTQVTRRILAPSRFVWLPDPDGILHAQWRDHTRRVRTACRVAPAAEPLAVPERRLCGDCLELLGLEDWTAEP